MFRHVGWVNICSAPVSHVFPRWLKWDCSQMFTSAGKRQMVQTFFGAVSERFAFFRCLMIFSSIPSPIYRCVGNVDAVFLTEVPYRNPLALELLMQVRIELFTSKTLNAHSYWETTSYYNRILWYASKVCGYILCCHMR